MESFAPLISVVIRAHNAEATLGETLQSAAASTYDKIEIIVVDDGSTDATLTIAKQFARIDPRFEICRRSHGGPSAAFNTGFAHASGEYFASLDADDIWHPSKLQAQVDFARSRPDAGLIYTFARYIDGDSRLLRDAPPQLFPQYALCRGICESLIGVGSTALMKRSAVQEAGGCDESLSGYEDLLLQLAISSRHPIGFVPYYLVGYRVRPGSISSSASHMLNSWREARSRIRSAYPKVPETVHRWAHARRCLEFSEKFAWERSYGPSAKLLAEALANDPIRCSGLLAYRLNRHLRRRVRRPQPAAVRPSFASCEPELPLMLDPFDAGKEGRLVRTIDAVREKTLRRIDRELFPLDFQS